MLYLELLSCFDFAGAQTIVCLAPERGQYSAMKNTLPRGDFQALPKRNYADVYLGVWEAFTPTCACFPRPCLLSL